MDKYNAIVKVLDENIECTCGESFQITGKYASAENILNLFTPKLEWKQDTERVWRGATPFMYTFPVYLHSDGYWQVVKADKPKFEGTLDECKLKCEQIFMEMYLQTCIDANGQ